MSKSPSSVPVPAAIFESAHAIGGGRARHGHYGNSPEPAKFFRVWHCTR
jgi:hypothetical protein